jgi:hypothetical protein
MVMEPGWVSFGVLAGAAQLSFAFMFRLTERRTNGVTGAVLLEVKLSERDAD